MLTVALGFAWQGPRSALPWLALMNAIETTWREAPISSMTVATVAPR